MTDGWLIGFLFFSFIIIIMSFVRYFDGRLDRIEDRLEREILRIEERNDRSIMDLRRERK